MRRLFCSFLGVALSIAGTVVLTSCAQDDDVNVRGYTVQASYAADLSLPIHVDFVLPASFDVTGKSLEAAMAPEAVQTIDRLKPEYAEALATDALNFTEVRRRT